MVCTMDEQDDERQQQDTGEQERWEAEQGLWVERMAQHRRLQAELRALLGPVFTEAFFRELNDADLHRHP